MKTRMLSILILLCFLAVAPFGYAATYTVNQLGDTGAGSGFSGDLRYCITQANANSPGPNFIKFHPGLTGAIHLTAYLPELFDKLTIQGPGANVLTVYGYGSVLSIGSGATISLSGLTLTGGSGKGGGIYISGGSVVTLNYVAVSGNTAPPGSVGGGGIWNDGTLILNSSTVSANSALKDQYGGGAGGGIYNTGVLKVNNSTISGNSASDGAGIANAGKLALNNSTITANAAQLAAGGIMGPNSRGACAARNTILAGNTAGGGPADVWGNLGSMGHNLIGNTSSGSGYAPSDLLGLDPKLGPLQDNGGTTMTHALLPASPAIDAGDIRRAPKWDQRGTGFPRIVNGVIDIGSFEVQ
jgi:hypothetical protein